MKYNGMYRGVVVDNNDPTKSGMVRVRVFPMFAEVSYNVLPWAIYADSSMGGLANNGSIMVPEVDSHVFVFFENGDHRHPVYFASSPCIQSDVPDVPTLSRESDQTVTDINNNAEKAVSTADGSTWDEPDSSYNAVYPNNKVIRTNGGITIELDDSTGAERIHIYHPSGSRTEINATGDKVEHTMGDDFTVVIGDGNIYVKGTHNITSDVAVNIDAPLIKLGENGSLEPSVLGDKLAAWVTDELKAYLDTHTHLYVDTGGSNPAYTAAPLVPFEDGTAASGGVVYSSKNKNQ